MRLGMPRPRSTTPRWGPLREGMERLLQGYEPFPAIVVDGVYTVVAANRGIAMLLEGLPEHLLTPPLNAMRITLHPEGLSARIRNLREWRGHLLAQMERQIALARSKPLRELYDEVAAYPLRRRRTASRRTGTTRMRTPTSRFRCRSSTTAMCCRSCRRSRPSTLRWI